MTRLFSIMLALLFSFTGPAMEGNADFRLSLFAAKGGLRQTGAGGG